MSSRREVLIRILALFQRTTLVVQSMKNVAALTEDGAFALFFRPHPGGFDARGGGAGGFLGPA